MNKTQIIIIIIFGLIGFALVYIFNFNPVLTFQQITQDPMGYLTSTLQGIQQYLGYIISIVGAGLSSLFYFGRKYSEGKQQLEASKQTLQRETQETLLEKQREYDTLKSTFDTKTTEYTDKVTDLSTQVSTLSEENSRINNQLKNQIEERAVLNAKIKKLESELAVAKGEIQLPIP